MIPFWKIEINNEWDWNCADFAGSCDAIPRLFSLNSSQICQVFRDFQIFPDLLSRLSHKWWLFSLVHGHSLEQGFPCDGLRPIEASILDAIKKLFGNLYLRGSHMLCSCRPIAGPCVWWNFLWKRTDPDAIIRSATGSGWQGGVMREIEVRERKGDLR